MRLAKSLSIEYVHLITSPQPDNWSRRFVELGFDYGEYVELPTWFFGHSPISRSDDEIMYLTGKAIRYDESRGQVWKFIKNDETFLEEDLVILYLSQYATSDDCIIRDESRISMPRLTRFLRNNHLRYFEYIHHRVLDNGFLPVLNKKLRYLVANEELCDRLCMLVYDAIFFPPMLIDNVSTKSFDKIRKYVWSGHLGGYKNPERVFRVFSNVPDVSLDMYGGTYDEYRDLAMSTLGYLPANITHFDGVSSVPYSNYDGFISTSYAEVFANSCVESMSHGLKCVVSDLDFPYRRYSENTLGEVEICKTDKEFIDTLTRLSNESFTSIETSRFAESYLFDYWLIEFKRLIEGEI